MSMAIANETDETRIARLAGIAEAVMEGRATLASVQGITAEELEAVYAVAHGLYGAGRFTDALDLFRFLCLHNHGEAKYWFGLGACQQMTGDTAAALKSYGMSALLDASEPQVPLRAAECFVKLGDKANARAAAEAATIVAEGKPEQAAIAERARLLMARIDKETAA